MIEEGQVFYVGGGARYWIFARGQAAGARGRRSAADVRLATRRRRRAVASWSSDADVVFSQPSTGEVLSLACP